MKISEPLYLRYGLLHEGKTINMSFRSSFSYGIVTIFVTETFKKRPVYSNTIKTGLWLDSLRKKECTPYSRQFARLLGTPY
jgi:hypothetical protein